MIKKKALEKILDLLEVMMISKVLPVIKFLKEEGIKFEVDDKTAARNLLGKIGTRIAFGKDIVDPALKRQTEK